MSEIKRYRRGDFEVTAMLIESPDDIRKLREANDWHEGAVALLTYPTADPIAFVSLDNPKYMGRAVAVNNAVVKGPAGDFGVVPTPGFLEQYSGVTS